MLGIILLVKFQHNYIIVLGKCILVRMSFQFCLRNNILYTLMERLGIYFRSLEIRINR